MINVLLDRQLRNILPKVSQESLNQTLLRGPMACSGNQCSEIYLTKSGRKKVH